MTKKKALTEAEKGDRKTRRILLVIHIVLSALVLLATQLDWWSIHNSAGELVAVMSGSDPKVFQAGYLKVALLFAFVFTSYDLVADEDIQWPPLLASAFALGCCGQATYTVYRDSNRIYDAVLLREEVDRRNVAPASSANAPALPGAPAAVGSGGAARPVVADVASGSRPGPVDPVARAASFLPSIRYEAGLILGLLGSLGLTVVSALLTIRASAERPGEGRA